jgi:hypothetical protein
MTQDHRTASTKTTIAGELQCDGGNGGHREKKHEMAVLPAITRRRTVTEDGRWRASSGSDLGSATTAPFRRALVDKLPHDATMPETTLTPFTSDRI